MANMDDRYFNLGLTLGQGIRARQAEKEAREATEEALKMQGVVGGSTNGKIDYNNAIINGIVEAINNGSVFANPTPIASSPSIIDGMNRANAKSSSPLTQMMRFGSDGTAYNVDPTTGTKLQATQASPYNASADYGVDLNNPYSMAIMNAKNDYARAQKLGDEAAMLRAHATAEQARQQAQAAGAPIQSFLATNNADYNQALALQDQLRAAQVAGNQGFSYQDLANGKLLNPQITNPTQGVVEQAPTNAGTAPATAAKGVTTPTVGNQQTVQTPTAPNTYDIQAGWNLIKNRQNGGSANPFQMGVRGF